MWRAPRRLRLFKQLIIWVIIGPLWRAKLFALPKSSKHVSSIRTELMLLQLNYILHFGHSIDGLWFDWSINPSSRSHIWILVAIKCSRKWVETVKLKWASGTVVANFIKDNITCWFGILKSVFPIMALYSLTCMYEECLIITKLFMYCVSIIIKEMVRRKPLIRPCFVS